MKLGDKVRITGGVEARGKVGEVSDLSDPAFVGVRIPDAKTATETVYVTRGSVEPVTAPTPEQMVDAALAGACVVFPGFAEATFDLRQRTPEAREAYLQGYAAGQRDEREACARLADTYAEGYEGNESVVIADVADAIRSRSTASPPSP